MFGQSHFTTLTVPVGSLELDANKCIYPEKIKPAYFVRICVVCKFVQSTWLYNYFVCHVSSMGRALAFRADGPGSIPGPA